MIVIEVADRDGERTGAGREIHGWLEVPLAVTEQDADEAVLIGHRQIGVPIVN